MSKGPSESAGAVRSPGERAQVLIDADWGTLASRHFGFRIPLPDVGGWTPAATPSRWWSLEHDASHSKLRLRTWRAERRISKRRCLDQVYLWQGNLRPSEDPLLVTRLERPRGFDVGLIADVRPAEGSGLALVAVAYGAAVGRCYAAVLETRDEGAGAEAELGSRLRLFVDGSLNHVELISLEEVPIPEPPR